MIRFFLNGEAMTVAESEFAGAVLVRHFQESGHLLLSRKFNRRKTYQTKLESNQDPLNFPPMLDHQILYLYGIVIGSEAKPTDGSYTRYEELKAELAEHLNALEKIMATELADFNALVKEEAVLPVMVPTT